MSETKWTKGPWSISEARGTEGEYLVVGGEGQSFGQVAAVTLEPDARLCRSAPDLYKAGERSAVALEEAAKLIARTLPSTAGLFTLAAEEMQAALRLAKGEPE